MKDIYWGPLAMLVILSIIAVVVTIDCIIRWRNKA